MADGLTSAELVAIGLTRIMAEASKRAVPPRIVGFEIFKRPVNLYAGGITWVDEDYREPASGLTYLLGTEPDAEPDSPATTSIAAGTWNGTSFGRK